MIIDQIIGLADELGVPTDVERRHNETCANQILKRIETLFLIDPEGYLGERFRKVAERC